MKYCKLRIKWILFCLVAVCFIGAICLSLNMFRSAAKAEGTEKFTAVTAEDGSLAGFDTSESVQGALYVGVKPDAVLSKDGFLYAVTEFQIGTNTLFDYENGGLILHLSTIGNISLSRTRIYVFANGYSGNLFFARGGAEGSKTYPILNGGKQVGEFKGVKSNNICTIDPGISGTVTIPWKDMTESGSDSAGWAHDLFSQYNDWRVAVLTDVTKEGGKANSGIALKSISFYGKEADAYKIVEGFCAEEVSYSYDVTEGAEVDFSDIAKGAVVSNTKKWTSTISVKNYAKDAERTTIDMLEYGRIIKAEYVDEKGIEVRPSEYLNVRNISCDENGYTYDFVNIAGVPVLPGLNFLSVENDFQTMTAKFIYKKVFEPQLFIEYLDPNGRTLQNSVTLNLDYDAETETYTYAVMPEELIGDYRFVQAEGPLSGTIKKSEVTEENQVIALKLMYAYRYGEYDEYFTRVDEADGSFAGLRLDKSMEGALYFGIKSGVELPDGFNNAVTEFKLSDTIHDKEHGGLLIQYSTIGYVDYIANVTIFVKGTDNRFYSVVSGIPKSRTDTVIYEDGAIGSISVKKSDSKYSATIPGNTSGTWNIRWADILDNTHGELEGIENPEFRILIWTDVSHASAYENIGNGISIGCIATYQETGDSFTVVEGISTTELSYTYDAEGTADVNISDIAKGSRVYNTHEWCTAISVKNYLPDDDRSTIDLIEYGRTSMKQIPVNYIDESGKSLGVSGYAKVMYGEDGLMYSITPPEFTGYEFKRSDKELTGVIAEDADISAMSFNLTYAKIKHTITFIYQDTEGNEIAERTQMFADYGEYCEFEAPEIKGYTFKESSRNLNLTIMNDYTIKLTYEKAASGCSSGCSGRSAHMSGILILLVGGCFLLKKSKKEI